MTAGSARKHWVFDLDGTLVDSFAHYFSALEDIFKAGGAKFGRELFHHALTEPLEDFFAWHLGKAAVASAMADLQTRSQNDTKHIRPFDGIPEILDGLRDRGARVAVWTNRDLESAQLILDHTGLGRRIEYCVSGTCVERKPDPAGLFRIVERFGVAVGDVTVVGDHEHDVRTPKSVGARSVRASWHSYWPIEACADADIQFFKVADFSAWMTRL